MVLVHVICVIMMEYTIQRNMLYSEQKLHSFLCFIDQNS